MTLSVEDCLAAISSHTQGLARAAEGNLDLRVEHCPEWSMADLVWHVTKVHWFWNGIARDLPSEVDEDAPGPERPADERLISELLRGVDVLTTTLRGADQNASCWTWGLEENVWFITRHQVQEAAVHHWDAVNAARCDQRLLAEDWAMAEPVARDAVEEFLTHSLANRRWPAEGAGPLGAELRIPLAADTLVITDGDLPGTLAHRFEPGGGGNPAADVLLWLYRRLPDDRLDVEPRSLVEPFRGFSFTD